MSPEIILSKNNKQLSTYIHLNIRFFLNINRFKPKEIVTFISSMWHALPEDEKEKFKRLAEELRQNPDRNKPAADDSKVEVVDTAPATNEKADSN